HVRRRHRTWGREPPAAEAHDRARDYARARACAVESRRGGERDEAHRRADGGWNGDVHRSHADCEPRDLLPVAPSRTGAKTMNSSVTHSKRALSALQLR